MDKKLERLIRESPSAAYVLDSRVLQERIAWLKAHLPQDVALCYAVKANTFITAEAAPFVERLEICSPGEAAVCQTLGVDSQKMVISGVYKTPSFIEELVAKGDFEGILTAESTLQYGLFCRLSEQYGCALRVLLRLTNGSQFGMDEKDVEAILKEREKHPLIHIVGIQYFSGTQKTSIKKYARELHYLDEYLQKLQTAYGYTAEELEYGTGFPVDYFLGEGVEDDVLLKEFSALLKEMTCRPKIILELGRSMAACCGTYYTHIVDIKENKGISYALTDGGMHQMVYFGQFMAMKKPYLSVLGKENENAVQDWTICGSLCTMNDIIVKQMPLPPVTVGDVLCFERTGAYCLTEGISLFLTRELPAVYLIKADGTLYCLRRPFETRELNGPVYEKISI